MNEKEARTVFGLVDNFSSARLKKLFRDKAKTAHPDVGGSEIEFQILNSAFEVLSKIATREDGVEEALETIDGKPLSDLGKGYPLSVSAVTCRGCDGKGYQGFTPMQETRPGTCPECSGTGLFTYPCKRCGGTGKFKHPSTGKEMGPCHGCGGSGRFVPRADHVRVWPSFGTTKRHPNGKDWAYTCKRCFGEGTVEVPIGGRVAYMTCSECKGVGEIRIWNPVLPRGHLAASTGRG